MRFDIPIMFDSLTEYQKDTIVRKLVEYTAFNDFMNDTFPLVCPVCGKNHNHFIKKGFARGKQRYLCKDCQHKFVYDKGTLTYNSQQSMDVWATVITDTLTFVSIEETSAKVNLIPDTVFHMRHKILILLEAYIESNTIVLSGLIEVDEAYLLDSYKGSQVKTDRKPRKHGESAQKRGLSNEQICICTSADRNHHRILKSTNRSKPTKKGIQDIYGNHIDMHSIIINDGVCSYNELMEKKHCTEEILPDYTYYNNVYHLNTVNNLHSQLKEMNAWYRGVATKYLNRYLALLTFVQEMIGMDKEEKLFYYLNMMKSFKFIVNNRLVKQYNLLSI